MLYPLSYEGATGAMVAVVSQRAVDVVRLGGWCVMMRSRADLSEKTQAVATPSDVSKRSTRTG